VTRRISKVIIYSTIFVLIFLSLWGLFVSIYAINAYPISDNAFSVALRISVVIALVPAVIMGVGYLYFYSTLSQTPEASSFRLIFAIITSFVSLLLFTGLFLGIMLIGNAKLDTSPPQEHSTQILDIYISDSRERSNQLVIKSWQVDGEDEIISSSPAFPACNWGYLSKGDSITVKTQAGRFGLERIIDIQKDGKSISYCN
jgi:hypothetical protein